MVETIIEGKTRTRRTNCAYYTDSDPILEYMIEIADIRSGSKILEPCVGGGAFLKKIIDLHQDKTLTIDCMDIDEDAVKLVESEIDYPENHTISFKTADTLLDPTLDLIAASGGTYDCVIGNPPYGAWQDMSRRELLKSQYGGYVRETYNLFIRRALDVLKENGKLVFIVPDTFLSLRMHFDLRKRLIDECTIQEIVTMPSKFFPGVAFGYSKLCIIIVIKRKAPEDHEIRYFNLEKSVQELDSILDSKPEFALLNREVLKRSDRVLLLGVSSNRVKLINSSSIFLGDLADCVTGFYSGDNKTFLKPLDPVNLELVSFGPFDQSHVSGLDGPHEYIPIMKGRGQCSYTRTPEWVVKWSKDAVEFYKTNDRARFQNPGYYFREGIGVPMVRSKKLSAFSLDSNLFDQSVVGIFPKDKTHLPYLLAFMNSSTCNELLNAINHTANNSANYLKKIPVILDPASFDEVTELSKKLMKDPSDKVSKAKVDMIFERLYKC